MAKVKKGDRLRKHDGTMGTAIADEVVGRTVMVRPDGATMAVAWASGDFECVSHLANLVKTVSSDVKVGKYKFPVPGDNEYGSDEEYWRNMRRLAGVQCCSVPGCPGCDGFVTGGAGGNCMTCGHAPSDHSC